jgi:hypothetical protein
MMMMMSAFKFQYFCSSTSTLFLQICMLLIKKSLQLVWKPEVYLHIDTLPIHSQLKHVHSPILFVKDLFQFYTLMFIYVFQLASYLQVLQLKLHTSHHSTTNYLGLSISSVFNLSVQYLANIKNYEAPQ